MGEPVAPSQGKPRAARQFDVFLSHNSIDKPTVERLADKLREAGLEPWLDRWYLTGGGLWQDELAAALRASATCAVFIGANGFGDWGREELAVAQDRATRDRAFRLVPVLLPGLPDPFDPSSVLPPFLLNRTWVDVRTGVEDPDGFRRLVGAITGVPLGPSQAEPQIQNPPYRGLRPFDEEHAAFFFGRDADVQRLLEKLKGSRFLTVLGPSGSGKSSLVRAGLVPALRRGEPPGSGTWPIRILTPGARPLESLAVCLAELGAGPDLVGAARLFRANLKEDQQALHLAIRLAPHAKSAGDRTVLVVDQFEEVFTLCHDEAERAQFLANLLYAATVPDGTCVVVLTLRADFYQRCAAYPALASQVAAQQFIVSPMTQESLLHVIEDPALQVGLEFEPGLVDAILADVAKQPGALPLLEHTLWELWQRRRGRRLTLEGYRDTGGVAGALAKRADEIYERLSSAEQIVASRVLLRLTEPGEGTEDTRRRAGLDELVSRADESATVEGVVRALADARLLTTSGDEATGERTVEVAHEALIRAWPRLRAWIDEDRAGLRVLRRLTEAAHDWDLAKPDDGMLYRGARLVEAIEWRTHNENTLNDLERKFLDASLALRDREHREASFARLWKIAMAPLVVLLVAAIAAIAYVAQLNQSVTKNGQIALARQLAAESLTLVHDRLDLAWLLSSQAFQLEPNSVEVRGSLHAVRDFSPRLDHFLHAHENTVYSVAVSPDGAWLASAGAEGTIQIWDTRTDQPVRKLRQPDVRSIAFSGDSHMLAAGGADSVVRAWSATAGDPLWAASAPAAVQTVASSPTSEIVASGDANGDVLLWDAHSGARLPAGAAMHHNAGVNGVAFSPRGEALVSVGADGALRLWQIDSQTQIAVLRGPNAEVLLSVAYSPDGRTLAAGDQFGVIHLWRTDTRTEIGSLQGPMREVHSVAFSADSRVLASGASDQTVRLWDLSSMQQIGEPLLGHAEGVWTVAFCCGDDRQEVYSGAADATIIRWQAGPRLAFSQVWSLSTDIYSLAYNQDGTRLATAAGDGQVTLWEISAGKKLATFVLPRDDTNRQVVVPSVAFGQHGALAVAGADRVWSWNPADAPPTSTQLLVTAGSTIQALAFAPDGLTLATGSDDGVVRVWDARTGQPAGEFAGNTEGVLGLTFSPNGKLIASAGKDRSVRVWNTVDGTSKAVLQGHVGWVYSVAFSPDGSLLASGGDRTVRIWDMSTNQLIRVQIGHTDWVRSVAFNRAGTLLASASADRSVRLWDATTGSLLGTPFTGHAAPVYSVAFGPQQESVLASGGAGGVWLRNLDLAAWDQHVCTAVGRSFTANERSQYLGSENRLPVCTT